MAYRPELVKLVSERETEEKVKKLRKFIENAAAADRKEGVPVDTEGRVDMRAFRGLYADVEKDRANVQMWFKEEFSKKQPGQSEGQFTRDGEKLELLIHAILYKNLRSEYIVARSALFDDIHGGIDNGLFDKETGSPICVFDDVGDTNDERYRDKQSGVKKLNLEKGGADLKYGLRMENVGGKKKIVPSAVSNIPIFYIALPKVMIDRGLKEFAPSPTEQSEFEKKLFEYILKAMMIQIKDLEVYMHSGRLNQNLSDRIAAFKKTIISLQAAKSYQAAA